MTKTNHFSELWVSSEDRRLSNLSCTYYRPSGHSFYWTAPLSVTFLQVASILHMLTH
ncbi:hypothetical protein BDZ91DRAFT_712807 [Kalaharituber pfeilii]|nr:hypothetical protein BDZ91DRAFT_712807 [Kalaharituber pfeilii]